jgi:hypothetical protein
MKSNGVLRIMAVALTLSLLILAIPVTPVQAAQGNIYISPTSGPPGTWVSLYGYGFTANVTYTVLWSGTTTLTTGTVSSGGTISTYFTVPTYTYTYTYPYTRGSYPITVATSAGDTSNVAYFTIISQVY